MPTQIEETGTLERKMAMAVPMADIEKEVSQRLRQLSKTVKLPGFRPGKVPIKMIEQSYGPQVSAEVTGDAVSKAFGEAVQEHSLRVAGQPNIERREDAAENELGFTATFEVYPEVPDVDPSTLSVDRVIDFLGRVDGEPFDGGKAEDFPFVLGEGRMLADFETGVNGKSAGDKTTFPVSFPEDYNAEELAGKTAEFDVTVKKVEAPVLPPIDKAFAESLGIEGGDIEKMRADIRGNLEREVTQRIQAQTKNNVMDSLSGASEFELPAALLQGEREALVERAKQDLAQRGMKVEDMPIPEDAFVEQAEKRVRLGLLVAELVQKHDLKAKPDQIKSQIEVFAQAYENPAEVVRHYFSDKDRLAEIEALVIEQNVVDWTLEKATVTDKPIEFDELMQGEQ